MNRLTLALPALEASIGASVSEQQLVISLYALGLAITLTPAGRVADAWSRRGMLIIGIGVFALCSIVAGLAPNPETLVIARLFQGFASGLILPQTTGVFQDLFEGPSLAKAYGGWGATVGTVSLLGPPITGALLGVFGDEWGWRIALLANVPVVLAALLAVTLTVSANRARPRLTSLDPIGLLLLTLLVSAILLPITIDPDPSVHLVVTVCSLLVAVSAAVGLISWERRFEGRGGTPLISPTVLGNRRFRNGALIGTLFFFFLPGAQIGVGLYLQRILGLSALQVALLLIGGALASTITAWFGSKHSYRLGRTVIIVGLCTLVVGVIATALVCVGASADERWTLWLIPAQMILGAGAGLITAPNQSVSMMTIPREFGSLASSLFQLGQRVGTSIGSAIVIALVYLGAGTAFPERYFAVLLPIGFSILGLLLVLWIAVWDLRTTRARS